MSFEEIQVGSTAELNSDKKKKPVQVYKQKHLQRGSFIKTGRFPIKKNSFIVGRCFRNICSTKKPSNSNSGKVIVWQLNDTIYSLVWCKFYLFSCSSAPLELSNSIIHLAINQGKVIRRCQTTELNNNVAMNVDECKVVIEAISFMSIFRVSQNIIYILR